MQLRCDSCQASIPAADVDLSSLTAKCRACDNVFSFAAPLSRASAPRERPALPKRMKVVKGEPPLPGRGYREPQRTNEVGELVIERGWFQTRHIGMLGSAALWNVFVAPWYIGALLNAEVGILLFGSVHFGAGLWMTYAAITGLVNKTTLRITSGRLTVEHGPLPWKGSRDIAVASLKQIYTERKVARGRGRGLVTWAVHALSQENERITLLPSLPKLEQAEYIEWCIEEHLGIIDDPSENLR